MEVESKGIEDTVIQYRLDLILIRSGIERVSSRRRSQGESDKSKYVVKSTWASQFEDSAKSHVWRHSDC